MSGSSSFVVLQFKRTAEPSQVWKALETAGTQPWGLKWVVAISEGIDPWDADVVNWMICFGMQPHRDMRVVDAGQVSPWDPSLVPYESATSTPFHKYSSDMKATVLLIDATIKWPYPPIALPKKEFMERALEIWQKEGLPPLTLKEPWWGYSLGAFPEEEENEAMMATKGEYYRTGEKLAKRRKVA